MNLQFHDAMKDIYLRAKKECKYNAAMFILIVTEKGGVEAARSLILKDGGLTALQSYGS